MDVSGGGWPGVGLVALRLTGVLWVELFSDSWAD